MNYRAEGNGAANRGLVCVFACTTRSFDNYGLVDGVTDYSTPVRHTIDNMCTGAALNPIGGTEQPRVLPCDLTVRVCLEGALGGAKLRLRALTHPARKQT